MAKRKDGLTITIIENRAKLVARAFGISSEDISICGGGRTRKGRVYSIDCANDDLFGNGNNKTLSEWYEYLEGIWTVLQLQVQQKAQRE